MHRLRLCVLLAAARACTPTVHTWAWAVGASVVEPSLLPGLPHLSQHGGRRNHALLHKQTANKTERYAGSTQAGVSCVKRGE